MQSLGSSTRNTLTRVLKAGSTLMVAALVLSACASGGDDPADGGDDPADGSSEALTDWTTEVEAICVSYEEQSSALVLPEPSEDQAAYLAEVTTVIDTLEALLKAEREEIGALDVPDVSEEDADAVRNLLDVFDEQIALAETLRPFLDAGDVSGMLTQLEDGLQAFVPRLNRAVDSIGVPACGALR